MIPQHWYSYFQFPVQEETSLGSLKAPGSELPRFVSSPTWSFVQQLWLGGTWDLENFPSLCVPGAPHERVRVNGN